MCFSGLPHLAVSSSTPPPSTSPLPVKIKSEPISPPREHHMTNSGSAVSASNVSNIHLNTLGHSHQHLHGHTLNLTHGGHHSIPRPSSTGQLTPTPGETTGYWLFTAPQHVRSQTNALCLFAGSVTPTNLPSPAGAEPRHTVSSEYDSGPVLKRSRVGESWAT